MFVGWVLASFGFALILTLAGYNAFGLALVCIPILVCLLCSAPVFRVCRTKGAV